MLLLTIFITMLVVVDHIVCRRTTSTTTEFEGISVTDPEDDLRIQFYKFRIDIEQKQKEPHPGKIKSFKRRLKRSRITYYTLQRFDEMNRENPDPVKIKYWEDAIRGQMKVERF